MGLDNGIMLRVRGEINPDEAILSIPGIEKNTWSETEKKGFTEYDICYWRKCWNIRGILFACCQDAEDKENNREYELTISELVSIRDQFYEIICRGPGYWDNSIWDFEEAMNFLPWDLVRLSALIDYMEENTGRCEAFFYDSY